MTDTVSRILANLTNSFEVEHIVPHPRPVPPTTTSSIFSTKTHMYTIEDDLGQGSSGFVKAAKRQDGQPVAIKCIHKRTIACSDVVRDKNLGIVPREVSFLSKLSHENIISVLDYFEDDAFFYIVMHRTEKSCDLFDIVEKNDFLDEEFIRVVFEQIVSAVCYLHLGNVVHRDIKDENVVVEPTGKAYLVDFGAARFAPSQPSEYFTDFRGSVPAIPPEVFRGEAHQGFEQDVWALGVLLFTMAFSRQPYSDETILHQQSVGLSTVRDLVKADRRRSANLMDLLEKLLQQDRGQRISVFDIRDHPWFQDSISSTS